MNEQLKTSLSVGLLLPDAAVAWLLDLWEVIQAFDDVVDEDTVDRAAFCQAIFTSLVSMPANPFFAANSASLLPALATMVLKWKASDDVERGGKADEKSFVWRAGYYDVVLMVVLLCHGKDIAMVAPNNVLNLYGESYKDYRKEFKNA